MAGIIASHNLRVNLKSEFIGTIHDQNTTYLVNEAGERALAVWMKKKYCLAKVGYGMETLRKKLSLIQLSLRELISPLIIENSWSGAAPDSHPRCQSQSSTTHGFATTMKVERLRCVQ